MESRPQNPNSGIILKTFTHILVFIVNQSLYRISVYKSRKIMLCFVGVNALCPSNVHFVCFIALRPSQQLWSRGDGQFT